MARSRVSSCYAVGVFAAATIVFGLGCKSTSTPAAVVVVPPPPPATLDQRISWILRLEQQRILRDAGAAPATRATTAPGASPFALASAPDLAALALDSDPSVRRRAVLAIGRIGAPEGVALLIPALQDPTPEVRASAAFGLGLLGPEARAAVASLQAALADVSPAVRVRAIEGLGLIGDVSAVPAVFQAASGCGALMAPIAPDDEETKSPEIEICRLALFALVRLRSYDAIAALTLNAQGEPVSRWWPVAYALQRINDPRAARALVSLVSTPGADTAGFALRGLGALKDSSVVPLARAVALNRDADLKVRVAAVRALGQVGGAIGAAPLLETLDSPDLPFNVEMEVVMALGMAAHASAFDALIDRLTARSPAMRAAALSATAKADPEAFLLVVAGLGRDQEWSVRAALATVLGGLPADRVTSALESLADDEDARVHGPALAALAALKAPSLTARLFKSLEAEDFVERATAARLIGDAKPEGGVPRLVAAYARAESDAAYGARAAALEALSKYGGDDARAAIRRGLVDKDWPVRWRAANLLNGLGDATAVPVRPALLRQPAEFFESPALLHPAFSPHAFIDTTAGTIEVELNVVDAALTSQNFVELARSGFFNGVRVHRLVPSFVIQAGDPRGDGEGGPGFTVPDELSPLPYVRGTMGVALDWRDTGGSQWFITLSPQPHLDAKYTVFGRVVNGWEILDRVAQWDTIQRIRVWDGVEFK